MAKVMGVLSSYEPGPDVIGRGRKHLEQLDHLIVVDDGSVDCSVLNELVGDEVTILRIPENSGIAAALNLGTRTAINLGAEFVVHLDQDSILDPGYINQAIQVFETASHSTHVGVVLTDCVNGQSSIPPMFSPEGFGLVDEGIQSGLVVSAECWVDVGELDERLFIDCVDIDFCLRVRDKGWRIVVAPGSNIQHSLGEMKPFRPFGLSRRTNGKEAMFQYHKPFRRYYITRNNIDLCLRNLRTRPRWVASLIRREFRPLMQTLFGGPHRGKQWLAFIIGAWHGVTRRRGKIPAWLAL